MEILFPTKSYNVCFLEGEWSGLVVKVSNHKTSKQTVWVPFISPASSAFFHQAVSFTLFLLLLLFQKYML